MDNLSKDKMEMKTYEDIPAKPGIYCILNEVNGKIYIGSAINLLRRKCQHAWDLNNNKHYNQYLQNASNKYGLSNFSFHIIEIATNKQQLINVEQSYLDETECYNRINGYNLSPTAGSVLGLKWTAESKAKKSEAYSNGKHPMYGRRGINSPVFGYKHTAETKVKMSQSRRGRKASNEAKRNMSKAQSGSNHPMWGKRHTAESKARMGMAQRGRKHSSETKSKISNATKKRWQDYYAERDAMQLQLF
jgi:group I intron endonuclease